MEFSDCQDEMVMGYRDGRNPECPEPSSNRSKSYIHGFKNGRDDLGRSPRASPSILRCEANLAIQDDMK